MNATSNTGPGSNSGDYDRLDRLAEEFADRYRRGERPSLKEYTDRHPELAADILSLFPALVDLERAEEVRQDGPEGGSRVEPAPPPPALSQVGDYRILREIGHGGMGVVYEAEQVSLGRRVALKMLPRNTARDVKMLERFRREARAAARLHHTNIVPVFEVGREEDACYYAMQFIQGQGLDLVYEEIRNLRGRSKARGSKRRDARPAPIDGGRDAGDGGSGDPTEPIAGRPEVGPLVHSLLTGRFEAGVPGRARTVSAPSPPSPTPDQSSWTGDVTTAFGGQTDAGSSDAATAGSPSSPRSSPSSPTASALLAGGSQAHSLESRGLEYARSVARIGLQAAQGLAYAHERGVVHRDIKPSNLLLDTAGVVWITDFGLAKATDDGLTQTGDLIGTLRYMAPERFRGEGDGRADVYGLGLTLYELLTLEPAFEAPDRLHLIERVKSEDPIRPRMIDPRIPRDLETVILKAIEKDQRRRYQTADDLAEDLRRFLDDEPILARRTTAVERSARWARRNPGIAVLGATLSAVLMVATAASMIVAGQMASLARDRGLAAASERAAKLEALAALREADTQRARAEENFQKARNAVDRYFTQVSESQLLGVPGLQTLRRDLLKSALGFYEDYIRSRDRDPRLRSSLAAVHLKAARIYLELGQMAEVTAAYKSALDLYQSLQKADPNDLEALSGVAECLLGLGERTVAERDRKSDLLGSVSIREMLVSTRPGEVRWREDLARSYQAFGDLRMPSSGGDRALLGEALRSFLKARDIEATLVRDFPENPAYQHALGRNLGQIAECLCRLGQHPNETIIRPLAIEHARNAYERAPHVVAYGRLCAQLLTRDGNNLRSQRRGEESERAYRQAIQIRLTLCRANPAVPLLPGELVDAYSRFVNDLDPSRKPTDAARVLREAIEAVESLPDRGPNTLVAAARLLARSAGTPERSRPADEDQARRGRDADRAVDSLRRAIAADFEDARLLQEQADFASLRTRDDFKALVEQPEKFQPIPPIRNEGPRIAEGSATHPAPPLRAADLDRYQADLAASQHAIGLIQLALGDRDEAMKSLRQVAELREALIRKAPGNQAFVADLSRTWLTISEGFAGQGRDDDAIAFLKDGVGRFEALLRDYPRESRLRVEFGMVQVELGKVFWKAGRLAEAAGAWTAAIGRLDAQSVGEDEGERVRRQSARRSVGDAYAKAGLWKEGSSLFEEIAFGGETSPSQDWRADAFIATLLRVRAGDAEEAGRLVAATVKRHAGSPDRDAHRDRQVALTRSIAGGPVEEAGTSGAGADLPDANGQKWSLHVDALAAYRAGRWDDAISMARRSMEADPDWHALIMNEPILAMAHHRAGRVEEARRWLRSSLRWWERHGPPAEMGDDPNLLPRANAGWNTYWFDWFAFEVLAREASLLIDASPPPGLALDHAHRGGLYSRLGESAKAEDEFRLAVAIRPDDPAPWLARGRVLSELGQDDRAEADFSRADGLKADGPRPWIDTGRFFAGRGRRDRADRAFSRAADLARDEPGRFLEAGWWMTEPFAEPVASSRRPEAAPDPSRPFAAGGAALAWKAAAAGSDLKLEFHRHPVRVPRVAAYAYTEVYSARERPTLLFVNRDDEPRVWLNDELVLDPAAGLPSRTYREVVVPVILRAGRNTLLAKVGNTSDPHSLRLRFDDNPEDRAAVSAQLGLWEEAAEDWDRAGLLHPPSLDRLGIRARLAAIIGDGEGYRRACAPLLVEMAAADSGSNQPHRDTLVTLGLRADSQADPSVLVKLAGQLRKQSDFEKSPWESLVVVLAAYRAGDHAGVLDLSDRMAAGRTPHGWTFPVLAMAHHRLGHAAEARRWLDRSWGNLAALSKHLDGGRSILAPWWAENLAEIVLLREARDLIEGPPADAKAEAAALMAHSREFIGNLDPATAAHEKAALIEAEVPWYQVALARRLAALGRPDRAEEQLAKALRLGPATAEMDFRAAQLLPDVIASWNFDAPAEGWQADRGTPIAATTGFLRVEALAREQGITAEVSAPAGRKLLTIRSRQKSPIRVQLSWMTTVDHYLSNANTVWFDLPATEGRWRQIHVPFEAGAPLVKIWLNVGDQGGRIEIDGIVLRSGAVEDLFRWAKEGPDRRPRDHATWARRGRVLAEAGQPDRAAEDFARALDLLPNSRDHWAPRSVLLPELAAYPRAYDQLLRMRPADDSLWAGRGRRLVNRGEWRQAAADFARGVGSATPGSEEWFEYACLRLTIGDATGYRATLREMARRAGDAPSTFAAFVLARTAVTSNAPGIDPDRVVRWAEWGTVGYRNPWSTHVLGLALYRAGRLPEALAVTEESLAMKRWGEPGDKLDQLVMAMIHQDQGRPAEARALLEVVRTWWRARQELAYEDTRDLHSSDRLPMRLLLQEAETLIIHAPRFPANPFAP